MWRCLLFRQQEHDYLLEINSWSSLTQETDWWQRRRLTAVIDFNPPTYHIDYHVDKPAVSTFKLFPCEVASSSRTFYHSDPICMMQRDDTVQTDGVAKFLLQRVFNNYSSGHTWNSFTQSSNTLTTYNDLCPESDDSIKDFSVIVTNICFHMENQDWMMTSVSQSSAPVLDQTSWLV